MGRDKYPKMLTSAFDLAINWKGDTKVAGVTPNDGVGLITELEEADIYATDRI